jgi:hypothetical protein
MPLSVNGRIIVRAGVTGSARSWRETGALQRFAGN